jgi:hypothetical protein
MMRIDELKMLAEDLGCSFEKGESKFSGYVLFDGDGNRPLGDDYRASLHDVEQYLINKAVDAGLIDDAETTGNQDEAVETGLDKRKATPTRAELQKAIKGHVNASAIKNILEPPGPTKEDVRIRMAGDHLQWSVITPQQRAAFDRLSEPEKEEYRARLRAVTEAEEQRRAAKLPKPTLPLREIGINPDHPLAMEQARQKTASAKADRELELYSRTNITSRRDEDDFDTQGGFAEKRRIDPDDDDKDFLPPPDSHDPAPKAVANFSVSSKRRRVSRTEVARGQRLNALAVEIRAALKKPKRDRAAIGRLFIKAEEILDHGEWLPWVQREFPEISDRTVRNYLKAARES